MVKCPRYKGKMIIKDYQKDSIADFMPCPTCEGEGTVDNADELD